MPLGECLTVPTLDPKRRMWILSQMRRVKIVYGFSDI